MYRGGDFGVACDVQLMEDRRRLRHLLLDRQVVCLLALIQDLRSGTGANGVTRHGARAASNIFLITPKHQARLQLPLQEPRGSSQWVYAGYPPILRLPNPFLALGLQDFMSLQVFRHPFCCHAHCLCLSGPNIRTAHAQRPMSPPRGARHVATLSAPMP